MIVIETKRSFRTLPQSVASSSKAVERRTITVRAGLILGSAVLLSAFGTVRAAVVPATSPSRADVEAAIQRASDGDTVTIPAGTVTWTSGVSIGKAITLQGAGIGATVILEDLVNDEGAIAFDTVLGKLYRLSGLEFRGGSRSDKFGKGCVILRGTGKSVRVDHCKFDGLNNRGVFCRDAVCGVLDHNIFISRNASQLIAIYHDEWNGGQWGDGSWGSPLEWGGPDALYIEDNDFSSDPPDYYALMDEYAGARFVFRHNTVSNMNIGSHGTGSTGRYRSVRFWEIYDNTFIANPRTAENVIQIRGGTGVVFGNTVTGFDKFLTLHTYRFYQNFNNWGRSDGLSPWDLNDPVGVFLSGTAAAGSTDMTLVVAGANWATDQWEGYTVIDTDTKSLLYPEGSFQSCVLGNTRDTITVKAGSQTVSKPFAPGDHFEIRRVLLSLDQVGASTCDILSSSSSPTPVWLHQTIDPVYVWNNTLNGTANGAVALADTPIIEGLHFFNNVPKPGYAPYTYPHPLVSGSSTSSDLPDAPSNLRIDGGL